MSNNDQNDLDNDLDIEGFDDGGGFDDFTKKGTLGDIWRNNPMVKIGVILAAFAFIVGGIILFGGSDAPPNQSRVTRPEDLTEAPGTSEVSESMRQAIEEENTRRIEEALQQSSSAVPTPVEPPKGTLPLQLDAAEQEDPLERWKRMQEERIQQQQIVTPDVTPDEVKEPEIDTRTPAVNALAQAMSIQMEAVLQNQQIKAPQFQTIASMAYLEGLEEKERRLREEELLRQQSLAQLQQIAAPLNILVPAGTIEYGQLVTEANTDAPGPVLVQMASGPLSGARLLGAFQATDNYLVLSFNQIVVDGVSLPVSAVAIDPGTTLPGMVTEKDNRYFSRVALPMAASFVEGLTSAISESGSTTIFIDGDTVAQSNNDRDNRQEVASGVEEAGERFSELLEEEGDRIQPMIKVAAGTPVGILFISPVTDQQGTVVQNPGGTQFQPQFQPAGQSSQFLPQFQQQFPYQTQQPTYQQPGMYQPQMYQPYQPAMQQAPQPTGFSAIQPFLEGQ